MKLQLQNKEWLQLQKHPDKKKGNYYAYDLIAWFT